MPRFGIFFVPPSRSPFYRLGTSILGYDVRREQTTHNDNFIRAQLPDFDESYVKRPQKHGIHCTIVAPQPCRYGDLASISHDIENILSCFAATTCFEMTAASELVDCWGKKQQIVVLKYQANPALLMLHTLLVSQLTKYITPNTEFASQELAHEYHRMQHFKYPFVFDGFTPHFTLLFPYKGEQHHDMQQALYSLFGQFKKHIIESICLMVQRDTDVNWTIQGEFQRADYPQAVG